MSEAALASHLWFFYVFLPFYFVSGFKSGSGTGTLMLLGSDSGSVKAKNYGSVSGSTILDLYNFLQVVLLDPVPGLHMYKLAQQEEERNLFTDFGPHCRALSARLNIFFFSLLCQYRYLQRETVSSFSPGLRIRADLMWIRIRIRIQHFI